MPRVQEMLLLEPSAMDPKWPLNPNRNLQTTTKLSSTRSNLRWWEIWLRSSVNSSTTAREATDSLYPTEDLQSVYSAAKPKYEHSVRAIRDALSRLDPSKPDTILGASSSAETVKKTVAELLPYALLEVHLYADYICEGSTERERQIRAMAYIEHKRKTSEIYGPCKGKDNEVPMVVAIFKEKFPQEIETAKLLESTFPADETPDRTESALRKGGAGP